MVKFFQSIILFLHVVGNGFDPLRKEFVNIKSVALESDADYAYAYLSGFKPAEVLAFMGNRSSSCLEINLGVVLGLRNNWR